MKKVLLVACIVLLCACGKTKAKKEETVSDLLAKGEYQIIDVRTADEFIEGHVKGAINIPYDEIETVNISKEINIFVYCKSGQRSKIAYDALKKLGYNVYDLGAYDNIDLEKES